MSVRMCPDCGDRLSEEARACECGWQRQDAPGSGGANDPQRHRCEFRDSGARCVQPGTISASIGEEARYFCRWHFRHMGDPQMGARLVDDLMRHPPPVEKDWRDKAVDEEMSRCGFSRQPGETLQEYRKRGRALRQDAVAIGQEQHAALSADRKERRGLQRIGDDVEVLLEKWHEIAARFEAEGYEREEAEKQAMKQVLADVA